MVSRGRLELWIVRGFWVLLWGSIGGYGLIAGSFSLLTSPFSFSMYKILIVGGIGLLEVGTCLWRRSFLVPFSFSLLVIQVFTKVLFPFIGFLLGTTSLALIPPLSKRMTRAKKWIHGEDHISWRSRVNTVKKKLFKPFPEGWFTSGIKKGERIFGGWMVSITLLLFLWLTIHGPSLQWNLFGVAYSLMAINATAITGMNWAAPKRTTSSASSQLVGDFGIKVDLTLAILILVGVSFASMILGLLNVLPGLMLIPSKLFPLTISPLSLNILLVGIAVPIIEESAFSTVIASSFIEEYGVVLGSISASVVFSIFHYTVMGASIGVLMYLFVFRMIASIALVLTRSSLAGIFAHIGMNILATFSI